ncbi:MAG: hypothetical protein IJR50_07520 [Treponema sp.]|nr:hypothetical protein [Treponema sp.]
MGLAKYYEQLKEFKNNNGTQEQHCFNHRTKLDNKQVSEDSIKNVKEFLLMFDSPCEVTAFLNQFSLSEIAECENLGDSILTALLKKHIKFNNVKSIIEMIVFFLACGASIDETDNVGDNAIDVFSEYNEILDYFLNTYCEEDNEISTKIFNAILYHYLTKKLRTDLMLTKIKKKKRPNRHVLELMLESLDFDNLDKSLLDKIILDDELQDCIKQCIETQVRQGEPQKAKSLYDFFYSK